ncbi:hypothetical protein KCV05_g284, partial [Aureobasidium melanogenum]
LVSLAQQVKLDSPSALAVVRNAILHERPFSLIGEIASLRSTRSNGRKLQVSFGPAARPSLAHGKIMGVSRNVSRLGRMKVWLRLRTSSAHSADMPTVKTSVANAPSPITTRSQCARLNISPIDSNQSLTPTAHSDVHIELIDKDRLMYASLRLRHPKDPGVVPAASPSTKSNLP